MSNFLYITADVIGSQSGGGAVTYHESEAMKSLGPCDVFDRERIEQEPFVHTIPDPWKWDQRMHHLVGKVKLTHFYAGTFSHTVNSLKKIGSKITYTAAAHSIEISKREHEKLGISYNYPHLTDPELWKRYVEGYLAADVLICPSQHSATVMKEYGYRGRVEIIPHGCNLPEKIEPFLPYFIVGYLGAVGPDKGLIYLLQAWKKLNYKDAGLLIAGKDSNSPFVKSLIEQYGGGIIQLMGWVNRIEDFYSRISVYIQASVSEGFGIEVLEAMAHGRAVICSKGAGASDIINDNGLLVNPCDVDDLAEKIDFYKKSTTVMEEDGKAGRKIAETLTWDKIQERYKKVWRKLL